MDYIDFQTVIGYLKLFGMGIIPALVSVLFYIAQKETRFRKLPYWAQQLLIGTAFGIISILFTEFSIDIGGAGMNVRDSAPLCAGLIFGAPAGILAGFIGGIERWFAVAWGAGAYTRLACTLGTIFAGLFGATARKLMFDDKKAPWLFGLLISICTEVFHMLLIFLTNMSDIQVAFTFVEKCSGPMISSNCIAVTLATFCVSHIGASYHPEKKIQKYKKISQTFQAWLLICILVAFFITSGFAYNLQTRLAKEEARHLITLNLNDVKKEILEASDENLLKITRDIAPAIVENGYTTRRLCAMAEKYGVTEINIVNKRGVILASTDPTFVGFDMADGKQSSEFLCLLNGTEEFVQEYQPTSFSPDVYRKYAAVALENGGFLQAGFDAEIFQEGISQFVLDASKNRHIGQNGGIIICDTNWHVVNDYHSMKGQTLDWQIDDDNTQTSPEYTLIKHRVASTDYYIAYTTTEGYYIIGIIPASEVLFSRNIGVYISAFMEVVVFAALFTLIYFLIKRVIVDNIQKVNRSLGEITNGNLDVVIDVRSNEEFASLSDDINATVVTLKHYIDDAAARIDKELEFAKAIQHSSLPNVFPPYPNRTDFDIHASMFTAKEVGGDFYNFYLLDTSRLAILIADVSGKGIPAAMFMMTAKTLISNLAESGLSVGEVFTVANDKLCQNNDAGMFVTAWLGILNLQSGVLDYVNAGHNPPVIQKKNHAFTYLKDRANLVLAGMEGIPYKQGQMTLEPGDTIYLYTDGITEATDSAEELFGEDRLLDTLNGTAFHSMEALCQKVKEDVDRFVGDAPQFDDITMLAVKLNHLYSS